MCDGGLSEQIKRLERIVRFLTESSRRRLTVIYRCRTLLTMLLIAVALGFGFQPALMRADGIANYTLTTIDALPAPSGPPPGTPSVTLNSTLTAGSALARVPSTTGLGVGYQVSGTGVPSGTTVGK